jgi:undecaprenyl-diphosphatase
VLTVVVLAVLQGITEFLPISSSGHLVLAQHLLQLKENHLLLDTMLHAGTAVSICVVFYKDIQRLLLQLFSPEPYVRIDALRYGLFIAVATIPAGVAGVLWKDFFEKRFEDPFFAGLMLLVTAALLFLSIKAPRRTHELGLLSIIAVGIAQACAIFPGISRSGATICVALLVGLRRDEAARFSFLLALPAILGAIVLQLGDIAGSGLPTGLLAAGFAVSCLTGIVALKVLLRFVHQGTLYYFGFYCVLVGVASMVFF